MDQEEKNWLDMGDDEDWIDAGLKALGLPKTYNTIQKVVDLKKAETRRIFREQNIREDRILKNICMVATPIMLIAIIYMLASLYTRNWGM
jgi:hypothetical protein